MKLSPYAKWLAILFLSVTIVVTAVMLLSHTDEPVTPDPEPPQPGPGPSLAPSATAVVDPQTWEDVVDLPVVVGDWRVRKGYDGAGGRLRIKAGVKGSLYPYSLRYEPVDGDKEPLDCGFYSKVEAAWRLAYCTGYGQKPTAGAAAHRLLLHTAHGTPDSMRLQVGNLLELYLVRVTK